MNKGYEYLKTQWLKKVKSKEYNFARDYFFPFKNLTIINL